MIKKPTVCIYDADTLLFESASAGEQVWYVYKDENDKEVARFDSAQKGKNWLSEFEVFGCDPYFNFTGDPSTLTRHTEYEIKDVEDCYKNFDKGLKKILKLSGCKKIVAGVSKKSGEKVFRYDIATMREYKKGRSELRRPHYLEEVRKYARKHPNVVTPRGDIEVDDWVVIQGAKYGTKVCVAFKDKDGLQGFGFWLLHVDNHTKPVFSSDKIVGRIGERDGKVRKIGYLSLMYQLICGDTADGIIGLKGKGEKLAKELLFKYDNKPIELLPEVVGKVLRAYYNVYGLSYTYPHWNGSGELTRSYKDIFKENLILLWMRRFKDDNCEQIMKIVDEFEIEENDNE